MGGYGKGSLIVDININVTIERMRVLMASLRTDIDADNAPDVIDVSDVVDYWDALDGWLSKGGFLPTAWER